MVSTTKKNTKRTSKAIISEEIMAKEIVNCKNEEFFGNGSENRDIKEDKEILELDEHLFHEGTHVSCYEFMGAHFIKYKGKNGVRFTTWAPRASKVTVVGDFSKWEIRKENEMVKYNELGLWTIFIPALKGGERYKFAVTNFDGNNTVLKSDPYAFKSELRPGTASILVKQTKFRWADKRWLNKRKKCDIQSSPMNIYELHLGSWRRKDGEFMTYKEISEVLPEYVIDMGYTHVEIMPLHEHPLDKSWGYQATGYYSPTSRHGDSIELKELINKLHKNNIGVILDWVPGHYCKDEHGLSYFDGTATYEYQDYWKANNEGWGAWNFDLGRYEVKSFLISNAMYWIREFHVDGLRVDAVSNMLYLNYGRNEGEWSPNIYGDNGNLEAISFLKEFNEVVHKNFPGVVTVAEESSTWPKITHPISEGGIGFDFKWNMGWMNDTLSYIELDPIYRKYHHNKMNFSMMYQYSENFILPISHDEVVHGKKSLVNKMFGDNWCKYAGLRLYAAFMIAHPGKKLLFMGSEFGQFIEWREYEQLQWQVIDQYEIHKQVHNYFKVLNKFYKENPALWELDNKEEGFEWIDADNSEKSILSFIRKGKNADDILIFVLNFTPVTYYDFEVKVPKEGEYVEILNSDSIEFGGSGQTLEGSVFTSENNGDSFKIKTKVPPLAATVLRPKL